MNQEKTYDICGNFTYRSCPRRDEKLMKGLINDLDLSSGSTGRTLDFSKGDKVNKLFCNTCTSFKDNRS